MLGEVHLAHATCSEQPLNNVAGEDLTVTVTAKSGGLRAGAQTIPLSRGTKLNAVDMETYGDNDWLRVVSYVDSTGAERKIDYAATDKDGNDFRATYAFIAVSDVRTSNLLARTVGNQPDQVGAKMRGKSGHSHHSSATDVSDVIDVVRKVKPFLPGKVAGYIPF